MRALATRSRIAVGAITVGGAAGLPAVTNAAAPPMQPGVCAARHVDEVDVIGYTSNQSDTDDHSSVQSSSDSGVAMSTSRLTLSEMMDNL
ncbi:hypothetical protein WN48_08583 [Eufriesea mexicana]|nr:hypothetical protein WN48_08583 [Eufriesea mexicana]